MNKKMIALAILIAAALLLSGCDMRFAMDEPETDKDIMVGMSLRVYDPGEPDGVDAEGNVYWYPDETDVFESVWENMDGDDVYISHGETELTEEELKALLGGKPREMLQDTDEYPIGEYFYYAWKRTDELGTTNGAEENWPGSVQSHITVNDEGEKLELDATVYLNSDTFGDYVSFHIDPIYQRKDGSVYCRRDLAGVSGHIDGFSQTVTEETKTTGIDGETDAYTMQFTVRYEHKQRLDKAVVFAFDAQHALLSETVLEPAPTQYGQYRCEYDPPHGAEYLLLEEHFADGTLARTSADLAAATPANSLFTLYVPDGGYFAYPCYVFLPQE